jgi:hypothetical protein
MIVHATAREFEDPNLGFSESCTKKNALTKLAKMPRVRHHANSIENRYNSLKILKKLFETFCPLHETRKAAILKRINWALLGSSLIFYFVAINDDRKSTICAETYTRLGTGDPASNKVYNASLSCVLHIVTCALIVCYTLYNLKHTLINISNVNYNVQYGIQMGGGGGGGGAEL